MPSTILVTGASGFVGSHLVPALIDAGHDVRALVRTDEAGDTVRRRLTPAQREQPQHHDRRRHPARDAAGGPRRRGRGPPPRRPPARLGRRRQPPPRQHGGDAVRAPGRGRRGRPALRPSRRDGRRRRPRRSTTRARRPRRSTLVQASGLDWTVLSPSVMYGPRDGFFNILANLVRLSPGVTPITGSGSARFQPFAVADLARAAVQVLADDATVGRELLLGGPRYWTYREIVEEVLRGMGKRRALVPMPVPVIRLVAGVRGGAPAPVLPGRDRPAAPAQARQHRAAGRRPRAARLGPAADGGQPHPPPPPGPRAGARRSGPGTA